MAYESSLFGKTHKRVHRANGAAHSQVTRKKASESGHVSPAGSHGEGDRRGLCNNLQFFSKWKIISK